ARRGAALLDLAEAKVKGGDPPAARPLVARAAELARRRGNTAALARAALIATERLDFNDVDTAALALLDEAAAALADDSAGENPPRTSCPWPTRSSRSPSDRPIPSGRSTAGCGG